MSEPETSLVPVEQASDIIPLQAACRSLAEARAAKDVDRVMLIRDEAQTFADYARRRDLGLQAMQDAAEIKIRAERILGELVRDLPGHGAHGGDRKSSSIVRLEDLGATRSDSSRWQRLASVAQPIFERHIAEIRREKAELTTAGVLKLIPPKSKAGRAAAPVPFIPADKRWDVECADCLDWFARQPADSIDLVFGSPPYEQARLYLENGEDRAIARDTGEWVLWMADVFQAALRCCTGLVAFVVEGQTENYRWSAGPALLMAELYNRGVTMRKPPIYKRSGIPGSGGPDWLRNDYEFIVCATRGGQLAGVDNTAMGHAPKYDPGGDPSHRTRDGSRANDPAGYASTQDRNNVGPHRARQRAGRVYVPPERANPGNVIDCVVGGGSMGDKICHENEAPFPESLAEFFIRTFCPAGGVVCDPFSGSGTTGAMAVRLARRFVGCDLRQSQVTLTLRRLANAQPPLPTQEIPHEQ